MNLSTIILAAGKGSRMLSKLPKVLHKVASRPLIGHITDLIKSLGTDVKEKVAVIGAEMQDLHEYIMMQDGTVKCVVQEERLGTGHAVKVGLEHVKNDGDVLVLYGDTPFLKPGTIKKMHAMLNLEERNALVILGFIAKDPALYGRLVINNHDELTEIIEFLDCTDEQKKINICNSGVMLINSKYIRKLLAQIKPQNAKQEYYLTDLVHIARKEGLICRYITVDEFEAVAINSREELARAEAIIQNQLRKKFIANGVTLIDQNTVYFAMDTIIENDVIIHPNVFFGPGVTIKSGTEIKPFSHIEGATIGANAIIGPFARIRTGTNLGNKVRIGNFVEIKNSEIKDETKINHLSYIGDAKVGENVNIGAGTITCNYDGFNKYATHIMDGVFIGSNTALIAPITIGECAMVAAGSVITQDVGSNDLAVARSKQENLEGKALTLRNKKMREREKNKPYL